MSDHRGESESRFAAVAAHHARAIVRVHVGWSGTDSAPEPAAEAFLAPHPFSHGVRCASACGVTPTLKDWFPRVIVRPRMGPLFQAQVPVPLHVRACGEFPGAWRVAMPPSMGNAQSPYGRMKYATRQGGYSAHSRAPPCPHVCGRLRYVRSDVKVPELQCVRNAWAMGQPSRADVPLALSARLTRAYAHGNRMAKPCAHPARVRRGRVHSVGVVPVWARVP